MCVGRGNEHDDHERIKYVEKQHIPKPTFISHFLYLNNSQNLTFIQRFPEEVLNTVYSKRHNQKCKA